MPEVTIQLAQGRTVEQKRALLQGITRVVVETCNVPADAVVVTIQETPLTDKAKGGVVFADR